MSNTCLDDKNMFLKNFKLGRFICSFLLLSSLFFNTNVISAQESISLVPASSAVASFAVANPVVASSSLEQADSVVASDTMKVSLVDRDGDGLVDAVFENKNVKVVLSSKTGAFIQYFLKGKNFGEDIYPPQIASMGYNLSVDSLKCFEIEATQGRLPVANYKIEIESQNEANVVIKATAEPLAEVSEATPDSESVSVTRRYTFSNEGYQFKIANTITNLKERLITVGGNASSSFAVSYGPGVFMYPFAPNKLLGLRSGDVCDTFSDSKSLDEKAKEESSYVGIGIRDEYFAVIMESDQPVKISSSELELKPSDEKRRSMKSNVIKCIYPSFNLGAKETRTFVDSVYAGPMIYEELQKVNRTKIGDFGFLNTMMLKTLRFFYSLIPNYGVAIILLTLLVRLILYPLTLNQTKSMVKMQKIQPKMKAIQDRYKDDPQKMNEEVMKLYAKEKVNPLGGCLPLLLQLPIIMALYNTFRIAVELRKAPFLWMSDLSIGDPFLILPIAIAALMHFQQGKTNVAPEQKQAMAFMPVMMFVITCSLPSGLLVYWFASTVLGLLQQLQVNRMMANMKEE